LFQKGFNATGLQNGQTNEEGNHLQFGPHVEQEFPVTGQLGVGISVSATKRPNQKHQESKGVHGQKSPSHSLHHFLSVSSDITNSFDFISQVRIESGAILNQ